MQVDIRTYNRNWDEAFLYSTWLHANRYAGGLFAVPTDLYNIGQRKRIDAILSRPDTHVLLACLPDSPQMILGWAVIERKDYGDIVHYVYVKQAYRQMGIGGALLGCANRPDELPIYFTARPNDIKIERKLREDAKYKYLIYNPYLLELEGARNA